MNELTALYENMGISPSVYAYGERLYGIYKRVPCEIRTKEIKA